VSAYILIILIMLAGMYVSNQLKNRFAKYSKMHLSNGLSGREIAERMLKDHGISDVKVISTKGQLTDHYNPANKTVNLSESVYSERNAAAAAVAAHEVGHAVQHATAYSWLTMRSKLVPVVSVSSRFLQWVILGGILLLNTFPQLMLIGIGMFALTTIFSLITLPVEYDASNRALAWIKSKGIVYSSEYAASEDALKWAARTYLVAAIGSIASLLYYVMIYMGRRK
jgi:Zn-dependent membrane protease YugP